MLILFIDCLRQGEELKGEEGSELSILNAIYVEKKLKARQMEKAGSRNEEIINNWVDQWRDRR